MSFSPRARPNTVNLSFTDPDLTDTYRDDRTTSSCSSPRHRHARGDTPVSRRQETISGDESNTKGSVTPAQDRSDVDAASERSFNSSSARTYHPSSQASPLFALCSSSTSSISFPFSYRPSSASASRPSSALAMFSRTNGSTTSGRAMDGMPDSPSPRPGSVAALRKNEGDRSNIAEGTSKGEEREPEYLEGDSLPEDGTEPSVDSITRVAEAALKEFEGIVSRGTSPSSRHDRPPSRLRNIRSPTRSPSPPATNHHRMSSSTRHSYEDVDATYTQQHYQQPQHPAPSRSEQDINTQLVAELRDAQDYIAYLQDELRAIRDVVVQLREVPEALPLPNGHALHSAPPSKPHPPSSQPTPTAAAELTNASQEAFEVVKHLIALLPSLSLSPATQPSPSSQSHPSAVAPPSLHSLSLALRFTRSLDALVHHGQERRDEDVFEEGNLGRVERRVRGWERAVREGGGIAGEGATDDARG
ncbi:hypothetical protein JCM5296_006737 [Sporobolomyces johnsonii]